MNYIQYHTFYILLFFIFSASLCAQEIPQPSLQKEHLFTQYASIDARAKTAPDALYDLDSIVSYLTEGLLDPKDKIRSFYAWIAYHIAYDVSLSKLDPLQRPKYDSDAQIVEEVLLKRKGVCMHYSKLFKAMCESIGVKSYYIKGYTRDQKGEIAQVSHAWNAIELDCQYYLFDVTWASGYVDQDTDEFIARFSNEYFMTPSRSFIYSHIPYDPIWQFLDNPISHQDFIRQNFKKLSQSGSFNYKDSIKVSQSRNYLDRLIYTNVRISKGKKLKHHLVNTHIDYNMFNMAVEIYNYSIKQYNSYIDLVREDKSVSVQSVQTQRKIQGVFNGIKKSKDLLASLFKTVEDERLRLKIENFKAQLIDYSNYVSKAIKNDMDYESYNTMVNNVNLVLDRYNSLNNYSNKTIEDHKNTLRYLYQIEKDLYHYSKQLKNLEVSDSSLKQHILKLDNQIIRSISDIGYYKEQHDYKIVELLFNEATLGLKAYFDYKNTTVDPIPMVKKQLFIQLTTLRQDFAKVFNLLGKMELQDRELAQYASLLETKVRYQLSVIGTETERMGKYVISKKSKHIFDLPKFK